MSKVPVPSHAVGRAGMVAMLQRVRPEDIGKLVAVRFPVGYVSTLTDSSRPVFAWQVLALGGPIDLNGKSCHEFLVADRCLKPVSQIEPEQVDALAKARAHRDFDEALVDLRRLLATNPMTAEELDAQLERAAEQVVIQRALEVVAVPAVLKELDFRTTFGNEDGAWRWSGMHEGVELAVMAGPDMFGRWIIVGNCNKARELMWDERVLTGEEPRGKVALLILGLWRSAFGECVPVPANLQLAQMYERHMADMNRIAGGLPTLHVDGEVLRATRRWIAQRYGLWPGGMGPLPDKALALSFDNGQLRIEVADEVYGVPARGVWVEDCRVSLREFAAMPPWLLRGYYLRLERSVDAVSLNGYSLAVQPEN